MDTRGQGSGYSAGDTPDPAGSEPAYPGYLTRGILDPATYYYRRVFTDAVLAVDAVRELLGVDGSRVAVAGGSQGGGIALAGAGLRDDLAAVLADVPFLSDFRRTAGTMFAALYGDPAPNAWRDRESEPDAHSLFLDRSLAMGWLDDRSAGGGYEDHMLRAPGLWAMNDAGWNHPLAAPGPPELISWFQVEASAVAGDRPLPVQPFLRCAESATARAGALHLSGDHPVWWTTR